MRFYCLFLCLLGFLTTSGSPIVGEESMMKESSSVVRSGNSFFINVPESQKNSPFISGDIYCAQDAQYTFTFGFNGSGSYRVVVGDEVLTSGNGASLRTFTLNLKAGYNHCSVTVSAGSTGFAYGRLVITHINGDTSYPDADGYMDLVANDQ